MIYYMELAVSEFHGPCELWEYYDDQAETDDGEFFPSVMLSDEPGEPNGWREEAERRWRRTH